MGASSQPTFCIKGCSTGSLPLWDKAALEARGRGRRQGRRQRATLTKSFGQMRGKRSRTRILMESRRARLEGSRRPRNVVQKKVRTLRKLVPNSETVGPDGLFREAADYIMSLQMRVRVMQIMVNVLSGSDE